MGPEQTRSSALRVRIVMGYPLSIMLGGFEHQALATCEALRALGVDAALMDWNKSDDAFDILHFFGAFPGWYEISQAAAGKARHVVTVLGAPPAWQQPIYKFRGRFTACVGKLLRQQTDYGRVHDTLRRAGAVIALNEAQGQFYQMAYDVPPRKMAIVPNGVPASRSSADPLLFATRYGIRDYVLLTGNIVRRKRPLELARVLKRRGLNGVFIGSTLNSASERVYAAEFGACVKGSSNLVWVKGLAYDDPLLDSAYAGAKMFCLPSVSESQPLSAMEAMAAGVPVILADMPYAHQAPFEQAVRCRPDNERSLEDALDLVLGQPERYRHTLPGMYSWDHVAAETLKVYEYVMTTELQ